MRSSSLVLAAFIRTRLLLALVLGFSILPAGCFRSRMLNPPKTSNSTSGKHNDASVNGDVVGDGRLNDSATGDSLRDGNGDALRDGLRDGSADAPGDGLRDGSADGSRDGNGDAANELPSDSRRDGSQDGVRDGVSDSIRDGRLDSPSDHATDVVVCGPVEICGNGIDDDCNGVKDCVDPACQNLPACINHKKELCDNGIDDDGNGLVDCQDPACFGDKACTVPGKEVCNNNLDDDEDGLIDCQDPDCANDPTCIVSPGNEICDNGKDDNGDGLVDCTDPKCKTFPACLQAACTEDADFGPIASSGYSKTLTISTIGATASYSTCAPPGGVARVAGFSLAAAADVRMDFTQDKGSAHVVALFGAGVGQACDANPRECLDAHDNASATKTYYALPPGNYWLVVQSYSGTTTGSTTVTLSTGKPGTTEICDNGKDDDGDGAIDCADLDCASASTCNLCIPDINLGAIVVGGGTTTRTIDDTTTGSNRYHPSCAGNSTANDVVVRFSVKEAMGMRIVWQQTGDHVYDLLRMPPQGASCISGKENCEPMNGSSDGMNWGGLDPGDYLLVFKAKAAGSEGKIIVSLTAVANGGVEICGNHIDDDGDGLIDCDDPDCYDAPSCSAPMCVTDGDLGDIDIGTQTPSIHVDLTNATQVFKPLCGNGRGRAYKVNLLSPMILYFDNCTQTGNQVFGMSPQLTPLDLCDANLGKYCVEPTQWSNDCSFGFPDLQPGPYFILVQGYDSGTEGTADFTLLGAKQEILEICNNGIDDDGDGAVDCNDRKCAFDASCRSQRCQPEKDLGLLAIDGTPYPANVTTIGAGDDQTKSKCVSGTGGADTVVSFTLPGKTDLTIQWAQFGNHALMLYQADNAPVPCEANPYVDCRATDGASTGSWPKNGLAAGDYYLVVDADKAGSESDIILQISGVPSK